MKSYIINTETMQWPIYQGDFELAHPDIPTNVDVMESPFAWVMESQQPQLDYYSQDLVEENPAEVDGVWTRQWKVVDVTGEELERRQKRKKIDDMARRGVPVSVTMRQARLQLLVLDKYDQVNSAISSMGVAAQIEWEYATEVDRFNPLVSAMQVILAWTDEEMDTYFVEAAKI